MEASKELARVAEKNATLSTLSTILKFVGVIAIVAGVITFFVGCGNSDSHDGLEQLQASSMMTAGLASAISGLFLLFFSAIGNALNDIRNHTIADFNLRHNIEAPKPQSVSAPAEEKIEEVITHDFKVGDSVRHKKHGFKMKVETIKGNRIMCNRGLILGYAAFDADELEHYQEEK